MAMILANIHILLLYSMKLFQFGFLMIENYHISLDLLKGEEPFNYHPLTGQLLLGKFHLLSFS